MQARLDYFQLLAEAGSDSPRDQHRVIRFALLADCATQHFIPLLRALFRRCGIRVEIYEGAFNGAEFEARNSVSALYCFHPDAIVLINSTQMVRDNFYTRSPDACDFGSDSLLRITAVWDAIRANSNAPIIQSTFVCPSERFFGNYERKVTQSLLSIVLRLNSGIVSESSERKGIFLLDLDSVASWVGRNSWFDERLWAIGKSLCALEYLPLVAQNIVDIVVAQQGRGVKCVIVDLDNTLWGGVVGDDGPYGIKIGAHGDGETFYRFQCFLKELNRRGILLAVCSKNDHTRAVKPFQENAEMALRLDDFVAFVANWDNKPDNVRAIQKSLNIGFDSILFLDDNPFERAAVRTMLPEVIVPELPEDPAEWGKTLSELNLFEAASFSAEDQQRSTRYRHEAQRREVAEKAASFEAFLQSLRMTIEVNRFAPEHIARIVQLLQRSNQFNLTTRRHGEPECVAMMHDLEGCLPLYARLKDRFGDHGLIAVVVLKPDRKAKNLVITDWLMSCRVLTRGVEEYLMNYVVDQACQLELPTIVATYIPTNKNEMVKDFYARFGFTMTHEEPNGTSHWQIAASSYQRPQLFICSEIENACVTAS
jgi:FkbH-like protein